MSTFKNLVGKRINGIFQGNDGWTLVFRTVDGEWLRYDTDNDCCNSVWFNHINGVNVLTNNSFDLLRGALVLSTEDKDWVNIDGADDYDVIEDICFTLRTDRGYIDIEVRNSHNGYYGGRVIESEQAVDGVEDLQQVLEDF